MQLNKLKEITGIEITYEGASSAERCRKSVVPSALSDWAKTTASPCSGTASLSATPIAEIMTNYVAKLFDFKLAAKNQRKKKWVPKGSNRNAEKQAALAQSLARTELEEKGYMDANAQLAIEEVINNLGREQRAMAREIVSNADVRDHLINLPPHEQVPVEGGELKLNEFLEDNNLELDPAVIGPNKSEQDYLDLKDIQFLNRLPRDRLRLNYWAIEHRNKSVLRYANHEDGWFVQGEVEFEGGRNKYPISRTLRLYQGEAIVHMSKCGCIMVLQDGENQPDPHFVALVPHHVEGLPQFRIRTAAKAIVGRLDYRRGLNHLMISNQVKVKYMKFNTEYPELETDIRSLIATDWFKEQYRNHLLQYELDREQNLKLKLQCYFATHLTPEGRTLDQEIAHMIAQKNALVDFKFFGLHFYMARGGKYVSNLDRAAHLTGLGIALYFGIQAGVVGIFAGITAVVKQCLAKCLAALGVTWLHNYCAEKKAYGEREALLDLDKKYYPNTTPGIILAAKIRMKKTTVNGKRLNVPVCDGLKVTRRYDLEDPENVEEKTVEVYGTIIEGAPMTYPHNNSQNMEGAQVIRFGTIRPPVDDDYCEEYEQYCYNVFNGFTFPDFSAITRQDKVDHLVATYGLKRGNELAALIDAVLTPDMLKYILFVKGELYLGKVPSNFKPRQICSCPDVVIAKFSYYFHLMGKWLAGVLNQERNHCYASGLSPVQVGYFVETKMQDRKFLKDADHSNFDAGFTPLDIKIEKNFLSRFVGMPEDFSVFLENMGRIHSVTKNGDLKVVRNFGRNSGDLQTSFGNSLSNLLSLSYVLGYEFDDEGHTSIAMGDDSMMSLDREVANEDIVRNFARLGKIVELRSIESVYDLEFCSGRIWSVAGSLVYGMLPFRALGKLGFNHKNLSPKLYKALLLGIAKSMATSCGHVPILGAFLRAIEDSADPRLKPYYDRTEFTGHKISGGVRLWPQQDTYIQFAALYNMTVYQVMELEEWIESNIRIEHFPAILTDDVFKEGLKKDLGLTDEDFGNLEVLESLDIEVDEYKFYTEYVPYWEEVCKLKGTNSFEEAMESAYRFGVEEDAMYGSTTHGYLHMLFTALSWVNLPWGVGLHGRYNAMALAASTHLAAKKKKKPKANPSNRNVPQPTGGLKNTIKKAVKEILIGGGGMLGEMALGPVGGLAGAALGAKASKFIGTGSYTNTNSLIKHSNRRVGKPEKPLVISREDYVGDIVSSELMSVAKFDVNAGLFKTFGWGSQIAKQFLQWRLRQLIVKYRSTSSEWSGSGVSLPTVMLKAQYDVNAPESTSKREMVDYYGAISGKSSEDLIMGVECAKGLSPTNMYYIRDSAVAADADLRDYDPCYLEIGVVGGASAIEGQTIGEVYIDYTLELHKPNTTKSPWEGEFFMAHRYLSSLATPFGSKTRADIGRLPITVSHPSSGVGRLTFDETIDGGRFLIVVNIRGSAGTSTGWSTWGLSNLTAQSLCTQGTATLTIPDQGTVSLSGMGTNSNCMMTYAVVTVNGYKDGGSYVEFTWGTIPLSTGGNIQIWVVGMEDVDDLE